MPEMTFTVQWPDGARQQCYSPSLVMHEHLEVGAEYPVAEFVARTTTALGIASDRVRAKFGFACTSAAAQLADIENVAERIPEGTVVVLAMTGAELIAPQDTGIARGR
ncbi:MAG: hypothetical protein C0482_13550 [Gordonia sp.]|uniref:MSMEG_0570 family nitrogen starvation response protein n=1 Tax=Gordonia rubripertincta TaxID=36822 RepID=A0ABT4N3U2_GORRU|nr:MSMEG_0570 family nitrogen starvation response protein [Gordonia rubripertincta]MBA4023382.1 hypothetical protein [Gordonia sp. (in: high G+C Gram-positive bacteria)]MCZ4553719.1 MSMEG_0570 family nitrogen starvation response protein [Gordonia rubripertincta]